MANRIQRNKLRLSKWTAVQPKNNEKHFIVTKVTQYEDAPTEVVLEAIHSKAEYVLVWTDLKDDTTWRQGWC